MYRLAMKLSLGALIVVLPSLIVTMSPTEEPSKEPSQTSPQSRHSFKNLQILDGRSSDELYTTMQFINESLGVSCDFCHIPTSYESDAKKAKQITRQMMLMQMKINKDFFAGHLKVTCFSCHRGSVDVPIK
jgi:Photosynthetic reaction centre cytochrome C subunit